MTDEAKALVEATRDFHALCANEQSLRSHGYHATAEVIGVVPQLCDLIETQAREIERLRGALEHIGIYGCGMLNQPAAMNGPEEVWLKQRIFEMERTAREALTGDSHD